MLIKKTISYKLLQPSIKVDRLIRTIRCEHNNVFIRDDIRSKQEIDIKTHFMYVNTLFCLFVDYVFKFSIYSFQSLNKNKYDVNIAFVDIIYYRNYLDRKSN